jgi:hypothetical protein
MRHLKFHRLHAVALVGTAAFAMTLAVAGIGAASAGAAVITSTAPATAQSEFDYAASAFGTSVDVASIVTSGPTFPAAVGEGNACDTGANQSSTNSGLSVNLPGVAATGTIDTSAATLGTPAQAQATVTAQDVDLLNGTVTATLVKSVSTTGRHGGAFISSGLGTTFTGLAVLGIPLPVNVAPNTQITLPGIGYLALNEQTETNTASGESFTVNAIHIVISATNLLGLAPNTSIIVGNATTSMSGPVAGSLGGGAYGSDLNIGNVVQSGPSFAIGLPCNGTGGAVVTNAGVGLNLPGILESGTVANTAQGTVGNAVERGETTSTVEGFDVLSGLVSATVIRADAHVVKGGGTITVSDAGSNFASLHVAGYPLINADVAPNTALDLAGLGTLYLHKVTVTANSVTVCMIELDVNQSNSYGLPLGAVLQIGVAEASAS